MLPLRSRLPLLLPLFTVAIAAAIGWGGLVIAKQERVERLPRENAAVHAFAGELQNRVADLELQY